MTEIDPREEGRGQEPGADVGDDRDVPADPLLPAAGDDDPPEVAGEPEPDEG